MFCFFFFKQKTAYEMRISDWSSDVCSSDLKQGVGPATKKIYLVDGNLSDFSKDFDPGTMGPNVKGSLPGVAATDDLKKRLATVDPKLQDWSYAAESYDGTVLMGLAAIAAKSDEIGRAHV